MPPSFFSPVYCLFHLCSYNVDGMLAPIQSVLSSFLQNVLLFGGALFLCFFTSWRLAVLALCSIAPIVQITREYAIWSGFINKDIWAALGKASTASNQVCMCLKCEGNIRILNFRIFPLSRKHNAQFWTSIREILHHICKKKCENNISYLFFLCHCLQIRPSPMCALSRRLAPSCSRLKSTRFVRACICLLCRCA